MDEMALKINTASHPHALVWPSYGHSDPIGTVSAASFIIKDSHGTRKTHGCPSHGLFGRCGCAPPGHWTFTGSFTTMACLLTPVLPAVGAPSVATPELPSL